MSALNTSKTHRAHTHLTTCIHGWILHHWVSPTPLKRTIIALHGFTGSGIDFEYLGRHAIGNCNWIAPDLPGHGLTQLNAPHIRNFDECVTQLASLLEKNKIGIVTETPSSIRSPLNHASNNHIASSVSQKPILLGYSMGGRFALALALRYPALFSKLILISTRPGLKTRREQNERSQSDGEWIEILQTRGLEAFYNMWEDQPIIASQKNIPSQDRQLMRQRRLTLNSLTGLTFALEAFGSGIMPSLWNKLENITCPTLLISGENDLKYSMHIHKEMSKLLPQELTQEVIIPKAGHAPLWENQKGFVKVIEEFLCV